MSWFKSGDNWFNSDDFCHFWAQPLYFNGEELPKLTGFYVMGEWKHNGEEISITGNFETSEAAENFIKSLLKLDK